jgi:hypothetical protein
MTRNVLPEELISSLFQHAIVLTLQSHGYTAIHPLALNLIVERIEKRTPRTASSNTGLLSLLRRTVGMANTQRRTIPSPIDLNYAFILENIHTADLEDEILRWPLPPRISPMTGPPF